MKSLAKAISCFPGVQIEGITDNDLEGCIQFKCSNELSLAHITASIGETTLDEDLKIEEWRCVVYCDADYATVFYVLYGPEDRYRREKDAFVLAKKYNEYYTNFYNKQREQVENDNGLGVPDLSFVTVAQIVDEFQRRNLTFALTWTDKGDTSVRMEAQGKPKIIDTMFKECRKIVRNRLENGDWP